MAPLDNSSHPSIEAEYDYDENDLQQQFHSNGNGQHQIGGSKITNTSDGNHNHNHNNPTTTTGTSRGNTSSGSIPLNLQLLAAGWTRLEAVQRWVFERTLEYLPHPHYQTHYNSSMVQRVLKDVEIEELEQKYSKEIKADGEIQALQKQIRALKTQLQQERKERERLEKRRSAMREREQKQLDVQQIKLRQALESTTIKNRREYGKALMRVSNRKAKRSSGSSLYNKLSQPITTMTTSMTNSTPPFSKEEKEAVALEATILRNMHRTLAYQNQCDVAQKYQKEISSSLKRSRARLDNQQAEVAMFQMILEGSCQALAGLYPEITRSQESLIAKLNNGKTIKPRRSIPRVIVPRSENQKRSSFTRSSDRSITSISDLGESVETDSTQGEVPRPFGRKQCYPVFTSVEQLQKRTLQHLAGVEC